jgi:hypothetical protein
LAPITNGPAAGAYNSVTGDYDDFTGTAWLLGSGSYRLENYDAYPYADRVRITYSAGWDSDNFPADLKQALIELAAQKMIDSETPGQKFKRVSSGQYKEEYDSVSLSNLPANILEVVDRYRLPVTIKLFVIMVDGLPNVRVTGASPLTLPELATPRS